MGPACIGVSLDGGLGPPGSFPRWHMTTSPMTMADPNRIERLTLRSPLLSRQFREPTLVGSNMAERCGPDPHTGY